MNITHWDTSKTKLFLTRLTRLCLTTLAGLGITHLFLRTAGSYPSLEQIVDKARTVLKNFFEKFPVAWKDPRIPVLLPFLEVSNSKSSIC